jgi:hypothetical protein
MDDSDQQAEIAALQVRNLALMQQLNNALELGDYHMHQARWLRAALVAIESADTDNDWQLKAMAREALGAS